MRWKALLVALLALLLVASFVYFHEIKGKREKAKEERLGQSFYQYKEDIAGIALLCRGESILLSREERNWKILKPVSYPADPRVVGEIIAALRNTKISSVIEQAEKLQQYNLSPAPVTITPTSASGKPLPSLWIGDETPLQLEYFAMQEGNRNVLVVSKEVSLLLKLDLFAIRDKGLLSFSKWDISEFFMESGGRKVAFKVDSGLWNMTEPMEFPADEGKVASVLNALANAEVKRFIDELPSSLSGFGLEKPSIAVSYRKEEDGEWSRISFGAMEGESSIYVRRSDRHPVLVVGRGPFGAASREAKEFLDAKVSKRNRYDVKEFSIAIDETDRKGLLTERKEWADPSSGRTMDKGSVYALLASLLEMKYADFVKRDAALEKRIGSGKPILRAMVKGDRFSEEITCFRDSSGSLYLINSSVKSVLYKITPKDFDAIRESFSKL